MIKSLFIAGFVALATASPAYYGYSSKHSQPSYAPKETYHEVPKASYSSYKPSYGGGHDGGHGGGGYGGGHYEKPHPYNFGYQIDDGYGANTHQEEEGDDYGNKRGSYGYTDAYGIYRKVDYVADGYGFRAKVSTNEPGTADQDPADVKLYAQEPPHQAYDHAPKYQASYAKPSYGGGYHKESYGGHDGGYDGGYGGGHGGGYGGDHKGYAVSVGHYGGGGHKGGYGHGGYSKGYGGHSKQHFKMLHPKYESKY